MFGRKKDRAKISEKNPVFHARYIGCTETFVASGKGCTLSPVQRLWDNAPEERHLRRVHVAITPTGLLMKDAEKKSDPGREFPIENISFCNADTSINEHIFCWVTRVAGRESKLECHAVLCSSREKARAMALVLSRAFQIAYKDWKSTKDREDRHKKTCNLMSTLEKGESPSHLESQVKQTARNGAASATSNGGNPDAVHGSPLAGSGAPDVKGAGDAFAAVAIMDPDEEAAIQRDSSVQAAAIGDTSSEASE